MTKKNSTENMTTPWGLDDVLNLEMYEILVEKSDLKVTAHHPSTVKKIFKSLTLKEDGQYYLILPKLYDLSTGESSDINKITIAAASHLLKYQNLLREISSKINLEPKIVSKMLSEPYKYEDKYPILKEKKEEITNILTLMQSSNKSEAEVTIILKNRLIKDWSSIDTERLGTSLFNKISSYILNENFKWNLEESLQYSEEELAILQEAEEESLALSSANEQLALSSGGEKNEDPMTTLNPSNEALGKSDNTLTIEATAQVS
ncbi:MAG: hypothetical protein AB4372_15730 [Xenococcus sp. (in: cyanobacteria)]